MKRVTASDARKNWFRLLDEVVAGETVVIERNGHRVVLQRDVDAPVASPPDYSDLLVAEDVDGADSWGWEWEPESGALGFRDRDPEDDEAAPAR